MVYGGGNNCQQYENEINKSTVEQGEREMKEVVEKQKRRVQKERKRWGVKQERQREWSRHGGRGRKKNSCRQTQQMKGVGLKKAEAEKQN